MTENTCKREVEMEIPAEEVAKASERVAREIARVARVPGFRPGKAPLTLIRRRFANEIKGELLESLVPEYLEKELNEKKLVPVTRPHLENVEFGELGPLKFRASFEVLPEFELGEYKGLEIELPAMDVTDEDVAKTLEEMRQRSAVYSPVEGRAVQDGDYAVLKLIGLAAGGSGEPVQAENVLCLIGGEDTLDEFNTSLRGAQPGEQKRFDVSYPADYPEEKLRGKTYHYTVDVLGIKVKQLPELNDEWAKDVSSAETLEALRGQIRKDLEHARDHRREELTANKLLEALVARHSFPVPEAMVENQIDARMERMVRQLAMQGVDPRGVNVDWVSMRRRQRERAESDVRAEILLDRIATAEGIDASDEDVERELAGLGERSGEGIEAVRARLTKQGGVDRMKSKLRSDKTLAWLQSHAQIKTAPKSET